VRSSLDLAFLGLLLGDDGFFSKKASAADGKFINPMAVRQPHFPAKAKACIFLFMYGGPSHIETFDYKPKLLELDGKPIPQTYLKNKRFAFMDSFTRQVPRLLGAKRQFSRHGKAGTYVSACLPHLAGIVDDIAQYLYLRANGEPATIRVHAGNVVLTAFSTFVSRLSGLAPGILAGSPAGLEDTRQNKLDLHLHFLALGAVAIAALIAWLLSPVFSGDVWLTTLLLLVFAVGVQTTFFELIPLRYFHGRSIFSYNKWLWGLLFAVAATIFLQTMLNPDGEFVKAFDQPNIVALAVIVVVFCLFATAVWFYFNRRKPA